MSRIGSMPILIKKEVSVHQTGDQIVISGPKGELKMTVPVGIKVEMKDDTLAVSRQSEEQKIRALHGLVRSLLANMITGVSEGWSKTLELIGVGFRAQTDERKLTLNIGFSHPVEIIADEGITFEVKDNTNIILSGPDKEKVGNLAARIRSIKPPEPYKGKGIRYAGEYIRKKAGKAAKAGAGGVK